MEESDNLLLQNLNEIVPLPHHIVSLKDFQTEDIYSVTISAFELIKINIDELKAISKAQRFRSMTKLTQIVNKELEGDFQLNEVMNPSVNFMRKFILSLLEKCGSGDTQKQQKQSIGLPESNQAVEQRKTFQKWINEQYIHPTLRADCRNSRSPHLLKLSFNNNLFKRNLCPEFVSLPGNTSMVLKDAYIKQIINRKQKQMYEGVNRKEQEETQRRVKQVVKANKDDWIAVSQENSQKVRKIKKKIEARDGKEQKKFQEPEKKISDQQQEKFSVFQKEVSEIAEKKHDPQITKTQKAVIKTQQISEDPLENLKQTHLKVQQDLMEKLNEVRKQVNEKKNKMEEVSKERKKLEEQIILFEQRTEEQKNSRPELKKQAEKLRIIQDTVEGEIDLTSEVNEFEEQIKFLESQAKAQISKLQNEISHLKTDSKQKMEILFDVKTKLNKLETEYEQISEELVEKKQRITNIKPHKTTSHTSRAYYNKRISQMQVRWRQTQKQIEKVDKNVEQLREEMRKLLINVGRGETQIQNLFNSGKYRNDQENSMFKNVFSKCKKAFEKTVDSLKSINEIKQQIQEYETKLHSFVGKNYPKNIERIKQALGEIPRDRKKK